MSGSIVFLLAVVFAAAAIGKWQNQDEFRRILVALVPPWAMAPLARAVPGAEILLAVLLLGPSDGREIALIASALLLALFTAVLGLMVRRKIPSCGCFGESRQETPPALALFRNVALLAATLWLLRSPSTASPWAGPAADVVARLTVTMGLMLLWMLGAGLLVFRMRVKGAAIKS